MTPAARVQAAIEVLDGIIAAAREGGAAADTLISRYFQTRRYAGSKDRRAVRELVYRAMRRAGEVPQSGRAAMLGLADEDDFTGLFGAAEHGPAPIQEGEERSAAAPVPAWLIPRFDPVVEAAELPALLERAPLDLRVNRLKAGGANARGGQGPDLGRHPGLDPGSTLSAADVERRWMPDQVRHDALGPALAQLLAQLPAEPTPHSSIGLRLPEGLRVEESEAWRSGLVEVQDEGSQLLVLACAAAPGMTVVDLCAGAGGKTLGLAAEMANDGRIVASDTDRGRLSRMRPRLERAGVSIVEPRLLDPGREREALANLKGAADIVLVDAPCSGSGTWRRNPETRWRLTPERLERLVKLQSGLIDIGAELVRPGGHLVYAVCSMLREEGRDQAESFESRSSFVSVQVPIAAGRSAGPGRLLAPASDGTDGFFVARWQAPC
jgi:16S rRNA (cytosine967-C5)-methyltransferase